MNNELRFKIPKNATLEDVIQILNFMDLVAQQTPDMKEWIYEHQDWIRDKDE